MCRIQKIVVVAGREKLLFIRTYLLTLRRNKRHHQTSLGVELDEEAEHILKEVQIFTMASHLFWGLWSIVNAKISQIPFGYWEYASSRLDAYFKRKSQVIGHCGDFTLVRKAEDMDY